MQHDFPLQSRQYFNNLLTAQLSNDVFYERLAVVLDSDPYFMPGYLEMLWNAEERNDADVYNAIITHVQKVLLHIYKEAHIRNELTLRWTNLEKAALKELVSILAKHPPLSHIKKIAYRLQLFFVDELITPKTQISPTEARYLVCKKRIDIENIKKEIASLAPYWWQVNTKRREIVPHHRDTWSMFIRGEYARKEYQAIDGVHESEPSIGASRCPITHEAILNLAKELNVGLGRVAIVMLKPGSQVFRHRDSEEHLIGRDRYHLVVKCGDHNILSSGTDTVHAREGELWFFDNKVMHRAHNKSSVWRIHIIFDGYPLDEIRFDT